jgi:hypothetical protein
VTGTSPRAIRVGQQVVPEEHGEQEGGFVRVCVRVCGVRVVVVRACVGRVETHMLKLIYAGNNIRR